MFNIKIIALAPNFVDKGIERHFNYVRYRMKAGFRLPFFVRTDNINTYVTKEREFVVFRYYKIPNHNLKWNRFSHLAMGRLY